MNRNGFSLIQAVPFINFGLLLEVIDVPLVSSKSRFEEKTRMRKKTEKEKYKNYDDKNENENKNDNKTSKHIENI